MRASLILADIISIKIITQERRGSRERPSPSSSSERDYFERGRPPRPWKGKKSHDRGEDAKQTSGTSGTKSDAEQRMIEASRAPHIVPSPLHRVQEVPFIALSKISIPFFFAVKPGEIAGGGEEIPQFHGSQPRLRSTHCQEN